MDFVARISRHDRFGIPRAPLRRLNLGIQHFRYEPTERGQRIVELLIAQPHPTSAFLGLVSLRRIAREPGGHEKRVELAVRVPAIKNRGSSAN
jgi:hypothetical protein